MIEAFLRGPFYPHYIDSGGNNFTVPPQFRDLHFRLIKVRPHGKEAIEAGWQKVRNYSWNDSDIINWIRTGGNYGITPPSGFACFVDADYTEIQTALDSKLPLTFRWSTGKPGHYQYAYFVENGPLGCVPLVDGAYIKGKGGYVIGPGSVHPSGVVYGSREIRDVPIAVVKKEDLMRAVSPFLLKNTPSANSNETVFERTSPVTGEMIEKVAMDLLPEWTNADHKRHVMTLAIIGTWERLGWSRSEVQALIDTLIRESGKGQEHSAQVRYAYGRGDRKYGIPTLKQISEDLK
jgi:hypothetical protein